MHETIAMASILCEFKNAIIKVQYFFNIFIDKILSRILYDFAIRCLVYREVLVESQ